MRIKTRHSVGVRRIHEVEVLANDNGGKTLYIDIQEMFQYFKYEKNDLTLYYYFESMCKLVSLMCL